MDKKVTDLTFWEVIEVKDDLPEITLLTLDHQRAINAFKKVISDNDVHIEDDDHMQCILEDGYCTLFHGGTVSISSAYVE